MEPKGQVAISEEAKFNMGLAILQRIDSLLYLIEDYLMAWDLRRAYHCLESLETELDCKITDKEREEINDKRRTATDLFNKYPGIGTISKGSLKYSTQTGDLRIALIELDRILRRHLHKYGLGMPKKSEKGMF